MELVQDKHLEYCHGESQGLLAERRKFGILRGIFFFMECYMIIKKKGWKSLIGILKDRGKNLRDSEFHWEIPQRTERKPYALDSSLHQGTWSPSRFILSIVVSFFDYTLTTMCALDWYLVGVSLSFSRRVFAYKFWGMICPHLLIQVFQYPWSYFLVLYIHWGQCLIQVWGYEKKKILPKIVVMLFSSMCLNFDFGLNYIGRLKVMNTWSYDIGILSLVTYFWQHEMLLVSI